MQAIIIAGGKGTRLRPLTYGCPKPMLPLLDRPFLAWMVSRCCQAGITDILINVHYQAEQVMAYFGDGDRFGATIRYIEESEPLDTAGAIRLAAPLLTGDTLVVFNADILTDLDLRAAIAFHRAHQAHATLTLTRVPDIRPFGLVELAEDRRVVAFREKPDPDRAAALLAQGINTINAGTYVLEPEIFERYPVGEPLSFERTVFPGVLAEGRPVMGFVWEGYWMDLGTPEKYYQASVDILHGKMPYTLHERATERSPGVWVANSAEIHPAAVLEAPCFIGDRCRVGANAAIPAGTAIGENSLVDRAIAPGIYAPGSLLL